MTYLDRRTGSIGSPDTAEEIRRRGMAYGRWRYGSFDNAAGEPRPWVTTVLVAVALTCVNICVCD